MRRLEHILRCCLLLVAILVLPAIARTLVDDDDAGAGGSAASFLDGYRHFHPTVQDFAAILPSGIVTAGGTRTAQSPKLRLVTAVGANKIVDNCCSMGGHEYVAGGSSPGGGTGAWSKPWYLSCLVYPDDPSANSTATSFVGIEMGTPIETPPYSNPFTPSAGDGQYVQLRTRIDTGVWQLVQAIGDGTTPLSITVLTGVSASALDHTYFLEIVYLPGQSLRAYINGALGADISGASLILDPNADLTFGWGCFVTSGTNAGGTTTADFYKLTHLAWGF